MRAQRASKPPQAKATRSPTAVHGHDAQFWREFCAELRAVGYDGGLSIEHQDTAVTPVDGVRASVELLRSVTSPAVVQRTPRVAS